MIEELEPNAEEINKKDDAQQDKIKELGVFAKKIIMFSVGTVSLVCALSAAVTTFFLTCDSFVTCKLIMLSLYIPDVRSVFCSLKGCQHSTQYNPHTTTIAAPAFHTTFSSFSEEVKEPHLGRLELMSVKLLTEYSIDRQPPVETDRKRRVTEKEECLMFPSLP